MVCPLADTLYFWHATSPWRKIGSRFVGLLARGGQLVATRALLCRGLPHLLKPMASHGLDVEALSSGGLSLSGNKGWVMATSRRKHGMQVMERGISPKCGKLGVNPWHLVLLGVPF
ncbi:hypothetical protein GOP47_0029332 [Adiantum capillus-veneris]|nr:hypothetical protein GOP47_0029332 [Adiantum capillus-veneris]